MNYTLFACLDFWHRLASIISWLNITDILHVYRIFTGNGYHWKGMYVESMQKALCRGLKTKAKHFPDVRFWRQLTIQNWKTARYVSNIHSRTIDTYIWVMTWQNQQYECAQSEDSDQPGHPPSLIRVFAFRSMGSWGSKLSSCVQRRLWSDWADDQADLSLRWTHSHFDGFVMSRLISPPRCCLWLVKLINGCEFEMSQNMYS